MEHQQAAEREAEIIEGMKVYLNTAGPDTLRQWQALESVDHPFCHAIRYMAALIARIEGGNG